MFKYIAIYRKCIELRHESLSIASSNLSTPASLASGLNVMGSWFASPTPPSIASVWNCVPGRDSQLVVVHGVGVDAVLGARRAAAVVGVGVHVEGRVRVHQQHRLQRQGLARP